MQRSLDEEVQRYVGTGEHDNHLFVGWPGSNLGARAEQGHAALGSALVAEVRKRTPHAAVPEALRGLAVAARNGWKRILARCAPPRGVRHAAPRIA